jgi:hypothetical protein
MKDSRIDLKHKALGYPAVGRLLSMDGQTEERRLKKLDEFQKA